jgi:hypothetical protein
MLADVFLADVEALASEAGRVLLSQLPPYDPKHAMARAEQLAAQGLEPSLVSAAMTQSRLQAKARAKFGEFADGLLFTDDGLQQATRLNVAGHRAGRFLAAGLVDVVDMTCGIGADSLALAGLGAKVTAYELDPVTAAVARANLARFPGARVFNQSSLDADLSRFQAALADPSRRNVNGVRTLTPALYSPPLETLFGVRHGRPIAIKAAPGLPHSYIPSDAEAEWVSVDGQVVETGLYFGPLAHEGRPGRTALVIKRGKAHHLRQQPPLGLFRTAAVLDVGPIQEYLYEPDGAVIRASLLAHAAAAANLLDATLISPRIAYLTASTAVANPFLSGYRVLDAFGFQLKRLRQYVRERNVGRITIKKRGTAVDPADLSKRLDLAGDGEMTIVLTRLGEEQSVLVVSPLP